MNDSLEKFVKFQKHFIKFGEKTIACEQEKLGKRKNQARDALNIVPNLCCIYAVRAV